MYKAREKYSMLTSGRTQFLDTAVECSELTLPYLVRQDDDASGKRTLLQPLKTSPDKYLDKTFWLDASDRLMYEGKAPQFADTKAARMPAFFEHANTNLPQYA